MSEYLYPGRVNNSSEKSAIKVFGNRFKSDQTMYEYLIEFLLIYMSAKNDGSSEELRFHNAQEINSKQLSFHIKSNMGLRRFIFFDKAKQGGKIAVDQQAYDDLISELKQHIECDTDERAEELIAAIKDLLYGYAVVVKNRTWCAQAVLPLCKELVFCEAMPNVSSRKKIARNTNDINEIDGDFARDKRNFLARGGELYYLHLLQALDNQPEKKAKLELLLNYMLTEQCKKISNVCSFIEQTWENKKNYTSSVGTSNLKISGIPFGGYKKAGEYAVDELIGFLSNALDPIKRTELLAKGVMLQVLRMMSDRVSEYLNITKSCWIVDMRGNDNKIVKSIAAKSFSDLEDRFLTALNDALPECDDETKNLRNLNEARKNSLDVFRAKGKEIGCIIPVSGAHERFSLSEDVVSFLVLSLIRPGEKITVDSFLSKVYEHYGIVIGAEEYKRSLNNNVAKLSESLSSSFNSNIEAFQEFLNATGFLKELSDATSLVVNPYERIEIGEEL